MLTVPLSPVPSQSVKVVLAGQNCTISLNQKPQGMFVNVSVDAVPVVVTVVARDAVPLVCREYEGFVGNLLFIDSQGSLDPEYSGLGSRWNLVHLTAEEYALIQ